MMRKSGSRLLPVWMLLAGGAALAMRAGLYALAVDAKGLLQRNHPLGLALLVLTGLALLAAAAAAWRTAPAETDSGNLPGAFGNVAAGAGILATVLTEMPGRALLGGYLETVWYYLGLAAPVCLLLAGIVRVLGKKPFFLLHVVPCLFFLVHIVTRYQLWSSQPQMQDYVFALLGAMALMFFCFYTAAMEADCGSPRMRFGAGLAAVYLCMAELARSANPVLYLGGILWVLADLCGRGSGAAAEAE